MPSPSAGSASGASASPPCSYRRTWTSPACSTASTSAYRSTPCVSASASSTASLTAASAATRPRPPRNAANSSECTDWAYDSPSEGSLPAAVGVEQEPGQFPVPVLGVVRQYPLRGVPGIPRRAAWQVYDKVGILRHRSYCA